MSEETGKGSEKETIVENTSVEPEKIVKYKRSKLKTLAIFCVIAVILIGGIWLNGRQWTCTNCGRYATNMFKPGRTPRSGTRLPQGCYGGYSDHRWVEVIHAYQPFRTIYYKLQYGTWYWKISNPYIHFRNRGNTTFPQTQ